MYMYAHNCSQRMCTHPFIECRAIVLIHFQNGICFTCIARRFSVPHGQSHRVLMNIIQNDLCFACSARWRSVPHGQGHCFDTTREPWTPGAYKVHAYTKHTCIHTHMHVIYTFKYTHMLAYTSACAHTRVHTCMHTHMQE